MVKRKRLLLVQTSRECTHLVVSEEERILYEEKVCHEAIDLATRKEDVLHALHMMGINLMKLCGVAGLQVEGIGEDPAASSMELANAISQQLNIPAFDLKVKKPPVDFLMVVQLALQITSHE